MENNNATLSLIVTTNQLKNKIKSLDNNTLDYLKHGIANADELALVSEICKLSSSLIDLLPQILNEPQ